MARKKIDVSQTNFGFPDEKLHPSHDEMVLWIKKNAKTIAQDVLAWDETWEPSIVERLKNDLHDQYSKENNPPKNPTATATKDTLAAFDALIANAPVETEEIANHQHSDHSISEILDDIVNPPDRILEVKTEIERPILKYHISKPTIVGYIDIVISARTTQLSIFKKDGVPQWRTQWTNAQTFSLDAKTEIRSLGELLRQFKSYQVYWPGMQFYIVSPDTRFAEDIIDEGFGFIEYPNIKITNPKPKSDW